MATEFPTIQRTGIVFRPGKYGAKGEYSDADVAAMASDTPLPIRMGHHATLIEKAGRMGQCKRTFAGFDEHGKTVLMGEWDEPQPLTDLLADVRRSLSVEIDLETRKPIALALEVDPHITDAAFFTAVDRAYAQFSAGEAVTPLTATSKQETPMATADATQNPAPEMPKLGWLEQLKALFSSAQPEDLAAAETVLTTAKTGKTPNEIALEQRLAAFEAERKTNAEQSIATRAKTAVDALIDDLCLKPADAEAATALFTLALAHDAKPLDLACFAADEKGVLPPLAKVKAEDSLTALFKALPKHNRTEEKTGDFKPDQVVLFDQEQTTVKDATTGEVKTLPAVDRVMKTTFTRPDLTPEKVAVNGAKE